MKNIQRTLIGLLLGLTALWLLAESAALPLTQGLFPWRTLLVQYSGLLGMGVMSAAMLLAVRPAWLEHRLHGLDKMYRLHKWLGIAGLVLAILHWLISQGPKWLIGAGLLERPVRGPRPLLTDPVLAFLQSQRGLAEDLGEKAFYLAVALIALALIKRFPYRHFFRTHRWIALAYLVLVWHSIVLTSFGYWLQPVGVLHGLLLAGGTVAALISLTRRIGVRRKAVGEIEQLEYLEGVKVNAVSIRLKSQWAGHEPGQFAFVTFDEREGAHPFTISSAWQDDGRLMFLIKALGDYTHSLAASLKLGDTVTVEGPYGRFQFDGPARRQIWIGGGIGISPFVARLKQLAQQSDGREIDLFHATSEVDETALQRLQQHAQAAGVRLHLLISGRDGRLTGERLRALVPDWQQAELWFCGPAAFGDAIRTDLCAQGLPAARFHQELFEMR
ncbi:MAG: ferric reductase [Burkholderiales bacterium RIFOXYC12_FULL_65_23]|uniref:ferredoxin reductase family protein n=1 Tax=Malikia spinosa TaxID=86180 RepID=UPI0008BECB3F|nr:MAG: ferric reductase [Burkholderiales bacterium RIFOXYC12_FULL_65_23]